MPIRDYSTFKIVPPPITLSPLYSTTAWPGAMARWGAAKSGSGTVYPQVNAVEVNATYQDWEYFFE